MKNLWVFLPIALTEFLNRYLVTWGESSIYIYAYEFTQCILWPLIALFAVKLLSRKSQKTLLWGMIITFIIISITTLLGNIETPGASKLLTNGDFAADEPLLVTIYKMQNIGDYGMIYTIVTLIPLLFAMIKKCSFKRVKIIYFAIICLFLITIYYSQFTTALVIAVATTLFCIIMQRSSKSIKRIIIHTIILFIICLPLFEIVLYFVAKNVAIEDIAQRLTELSIVASGRSLESGSDFGGRLWLWGHSLNTFFNNFFLGCYHLGKNAAAPMIGKHSFCLDFLACLGVIGLALLILMFKKLYILYVKPYSQTGMYSYLIVIYCISTLLSITNTLIITLPLVFFAPLMVEVYYNSTPK